MGLMLETRAGDAAAGKAREHSCGTCGRALGVITRAKDGPTVLTPYPGVALQSVTGGVVWLLCPCGLTSPWFVAGRRALRNAG